MLSLGIRAKHWRGKLPSTLHMLASSCCCELELRLEEESTRCASRLEFQSPGHICGPRTEFCAEPSCLRCASWKDKPRPIDGFEYAQKSMTINFVQYHAGVDAAYGRSPKLMTFLKKMKCLFGGPSHTIPHGCRTCGLGPFCVKDMKLKKAFFDHMRKGLSSVKLSS